MGDFVTNSLSSLAVLYDQCQLLQNVMHDVLVLEEGPNLDQVGVHHRWIAPATAGGLREDYGQTTP
jgi:hypothetical protein